MAVTINAFGTPVDFPDGTPPEHIESFLNSQDFHLSLATANPGAYQELQRQQEQQFRANEGNQSSGTVLPGRQLSAYDLTVGDTSHDMVAPGLQGGLNYSNAPRIPQPIERYEQPDLVTAFTQPGGMAGPTQAKVAAQQEGSVLLGQAPGASYADTQQRAAGLKMTNSSTPQATLGITTPTEQKQAAFLRQEYGLKPAQSLAAGLGTLASVAAFPAASVTDSVAGGDYNKEALSQSIDDFSRQKSAAQADPSIGILGKAVRSAEEIAPYVLTGGVGIPLLAGEATANKGVELEQQGVTGPVASAIAAISGLTAYAMTKMPLSGQNVVSSMARGIVANPALGMAQRGAEKSILSLSGHDDLSDKINVADPEALTHEAVMGAVFGLHSGIAERKPVVGKTVAETVVPFWDNIAKSDWYRRMTIPERGLVVQTYDDLLARGWKESDIAKMNVGYFQEALSRRSQGEAPPSPEEPVPDSTDMNNSGVAPIPDTPLPSAPGSPAASVNGESEQRQTMTPDELRSTVADRLSELVGKATADEGATPEMLAEHQFLTDNQDHPEVIALKYGIDLVEPSGPLQGALEAGGLIASETPAPTPPVAGSSDIAGPSLNPSTTPAGQSAGLATTSPETAPATTIQKGGDSKWEKRKQAAAVKNAEVTSAEGVTPVTPAPLLFKGLPVIMDLAQEYSGTRGKDKPASGVATREYVARREDGTPVDRFTVVQYEHGGPWSAWTGDTLSADVKALRGNAAQSLNTPAEVQTKPLTEKVTETQSADKPTPELKGIARHGLVRVLDVYGKGAFVKQADLDQQKKVVIRRYNNAGEPLQDQSKSHIHKDNIVNESDPEAVQLAKDRQRMTALEQKNRQGKITPEEVKEGQALWPTIMARMDKYFPQEGDVPVTPAPEPSAGMTTPELVQSRVKLVEDTYDVQSRRTQEALDGVNEQSKTIRRMRENNGERMLVRVPSKQSLVNYVKGQLGKHRDAETVIDLLNHLGMMDEKEYLQYDQAAPVAPQAPVLSDAQSTPVETSGFGPVYRGFRHDAAGAVAKLREQGSGEAIAALHHKSTGDIDLVWGREGTKDKEYEDGFGLAKIIKKHPEVVDDLQGILNTLEKNDDKSTPAYSVLESSAHKAVVRLDWDRKNKTWLLTEFHKEPEIGTEKRAGTPSVAETDSPSHQSLVTQSINLTSENVKTETVPVTRNLPRENRIKRLQAQQRLSGQEQKELVRLKAAQAKAATPVGVEGYDTWYATEAAAKSAMQSMRANGIPADRVSTSYAPSGKFEFKVYRSPEEVKRLNTEFQEKQNAQEAERKASEAAALVQRNDLDGFGSDLNALRKGAVTATLNKVVRYDGVEMTVKAKVAERVKSGEELSTMEVNAVKDMTRTQFNRASGKEQDAHAKRVKEGGKKTVYMVGDYDMGKTAYDYARHLKGKLAPESAPKTEPTKPHWQISGEVTLEQVAATALQIRGQRDIGRKYSEPKNVWNNGQKSVTSPTDSQLKRSQEAFATANEMENHWYAALYPEALTAEEHAQAKADGMPTLAATTQTMIAASPIKRNIPRENRIKRLQAQQRLSSQEQKELVRLKAAQAKSEPVTATVPDTPAEVVADAVGAAKKAHIPLKEQKANLLGQIDAAVKTAKEAMTKVHSSLKDILTGAIHTAAEAEKAHLEADADARLWDIPEFSPDSTPEYRENSQRRDLAKRDAAKLAVKQANTAVRHAREDLVEAGAYATFDVPGDGTFDVWNTKAALKSFRDKINKEFSTEEKVGPKKPAAVSTKQATATAVGLSDAGTTIHEGEVWHSNGHVLVKGKPAIAFKSDTKSELWADNPPDLNRVTPLDSKLSAVQEVTFVHWDPESGGGVNTVPIKTGDNSSTVGNYAVMKLANGEDVWVAQKYYVYVLKHHPQAQWFGQKDRTHAVVAKVAGKTVAVVMPVRDMSGNKENELLTSYRQGALPFVAESNEKEIAKLDAVKPTAGFSPGQHIKIAADSIEQLRPSDVYRVLSEAPAGDREAVKQYIMQNFKGEQRMLDSVQKAMASLAGVSPEAKPATGKDVVAFVEDVLSDPGNNKKSMVIILPSAIKTGKVLDETGIDIGEAREILLASSVIHATKKHPDLDNQDWFQLPDLAVNFTHSFESTDTGSNGEQRIIFVAPDKGGKWYAYVGEVAQGKKKGDRLNVVTFFADHINTLISHLRQNAKNQGLVEVFAAANGAPKKGEGLLTGTNPNNSIDPESKNVKPDSTDNSGTGHKLKMNHVHAFGLGMNEGALFWGLRSHGYDVGYEARRAANTGLSGKTTEAERNAYIAGYTLASSDFYHEKMKSRHGDTISGDQWVGLAIKQGDVSPQGWEMRNGERVEVAKVKPVESAKPAPETATAQPWHTELPTEGLQLVKGQNQGTGYRGVAGAVARDAVDAIRSIQSVPGQPEFYLHVMPSKGELNGVARLIPDDQVAPKGWELADSQAYRLSGITKEQIHKRIVDALGSQRIIAPMMDESKPANTVKAADFHPMRGHVQEGTLVKFDNGTSATISSDQKGWTLKDDAGKTLGHGLGANDLTAVITREDGSREKVAAEPAKASSKIPFAFGEKIGGARKDYATTFADAKKLDTATAPFAKTWPEPDYAKLLAQGVPAKDVSLIRALRDEIPDKPRKSWKLTAWTKSVESLRDHAENVINQGSAVMNKVMAEQGKNNSLIDHIKGRAELYDIVGHDASLKGVTLSSTFYNMYHEEKNVTKWEVARNQKATAFGNMPQILGIGNTREAAIADFKNNLYRLGEGSGAKKGKTEFTIYKYRNGDGSWIIGKKIGKEHVDLQKFADQKEARKYLVENQDALEAQLKGIKDVPYERNVSNGQRIGENYRNGKDVTPQMFQDALGFRGVEFGNYVGNDTRQQNLNEAFDALHDLAGILGVPAKALSLNGELGLAFGARGHGGKNSPSAHYESDKVAINLTKANGAGSLAHEFFHGLDSYFSRQRGYGDKFITDHTVKYGPNDATRQEVIDAFKSLKSALDATNLKMRSRNLDKTRSQDYWSTGIEMHARAFENYVIDKLSDGDKVNDFLSNIKGVKEYAADLLKGFERDQTVNDLYPYLLDSEKAGVSAAFDKLFATIKTRETDKGMQLYGNPMFDVPGALAALKALTGDAVTGIKHLETIGAQAYRDGKTQFFPWMLEMKRRLGELFAKFKDLLKDVWASVVKYAKDERGLVGRDIGAEQKIKVTELTGKELQGDGHIRENSDLFIRELQKQGPLHNDATGWDLLIGKLDRKKLAHDPGASLLSVKAVAGLRELAKNAVLMESHPDGMSNPDVQQVHRLFAPAMIEGSLYRAKLTVKEYREDKRNLHALEAIEIENPAVISPDAASDTTVQPAGLSTEISIADLMGGATRKDGTLFIRSAAPELGDFNDLNPIRQRAVDRALDRAIARDKGEEVPAAVRTSALVRLRKLTGQLDQGKITDRRFIAESRWLYEGLENKAAEQRYGKSPERVRGADYIRQRLLEAKRRGDLSAEEVNLAEWFILKNEKLVEDLGIAVQQQADGTIAGTYLSLPRIITLFKGHSSDTTTLHEILHHLERMMPAELQQEVQQAWREAVLKELAAPEDSPLRQFASLVLLAQANPKGMEQATKMILDGIVPYEAQALLNPSEYWATNATRVAGDRYAAKDSLLKRAWQWLKEALAHIRKALGLSSDSVIIKALNKVAAGEGVELSKEMLSKRRNGFADLSETDIHDLRQRIFSTPPEEVSTNGLSRSGDYKHLREEAIALYHGDALVTNLNTGSQIQIDRQGIDNALQHGLSIQKRAVVPALGTLLEKAVFIVRDTEGMKSGVKAVETYAARVNVDGIPFVARMVVRELQDGRRFYDHELSSLENERPVGYSGGSPESFISRPVPRPSTSLGKRILQQVLSVKADAQQIDGHNDLDLAPRAREALAALRNLPDGALLDNLKQFLNPLDWSRFVRNAESESYPQIARGMAYLFRNPVFEADKDPRKEPFVATGIERDTDRMETILRFRSYHGSGPRETLPQQLKNYFTTWGHHDSRTAWGDLQQRFSSLPQGQRDALDTLMVEGDANARSYTTLPRANLNPRIRSAGVTPETFELYQGVRDHIDIHVEQVRNQLAAQLYLTAAQQQQGIAEQVAGMNRTQQAQLEEALREWSQQGTVYRNQEDAPHMADAAWQAYRRIRDQVEPRYVQSIADARKRHAELTGWLHRDHGEGEWAAKVYQTIDRLTFDVDTQGGVDRAMLKYYPGQRLAGQLAELGEALKSDDGAFSYKQLKNGRIVVTGPEEEVRRFVDQAQGLEIDNPETGRPDQVLTYVRYVAKEGTANRLVKKVAGDLKAAMPFGYRAGMTYRTEARETNALTEQMYGDVNDRAVEEAQRQAFTKMLVKGEISKEEYDAGLDELIWNTAEVLMGRAAGRYQIRRAEYLIEGYDRHNAVQLFDDYQNAIAGQFSKTLYAMRQAHNFRQADGHTQRWAYPYINRTLRNMGVADRVSGVARSIGAFMYLGFKPATCLAFATNSYTFGAAELGRHTTSPAVKIFAAQRDIFTGKLSRDEQELFDTAFWHVQEQETAVREAAGLSDGMVDRAGQRWRPLVNKSMAPLHQVELLSRKSVILAAYRAFRGADLPVGQLDVEAMAKAQKVNQVSNHELSRANLPGFAAHGAVGRTVYSLQTFVFRSFNWIYNRMTSGEKRDMVAMLRLLGTMFLIGGAMALPGTDEFNKLYRNLFGKDLRLELKTWLHKELRHYGTLGEALYAFAMHGTGGVLGVNISNAHRVQVPFLAPLLDGKSPAEDLGGIYSGMINKGVQAGKSFVRGDTERGLESLAPESIAAGMKAHRLMTQGASTMGGSPVYGPDGKPVKYSLGEALVTSFGFHPLEKSELTEQEQARREVVKHWGDRRNELLKNLRIAGKDGRSGVGVDIIRFNRQVRDSQAWPEVHIIKATDQHRALTSKPNKGKLGWYHEQTAQ